jgi:DNA-binding FadR family transcriptional regulator
MEELKMKRDEAREAKIDNAKPVKNSGRGFQKGDATFHRFLLDYKHNSSSFSLTRAAWLKHRKDAWRSQYRYPCISVVLGEDSDVKVAIIDWQVFKDLIDGSDYE